MTSLYLCIYQVYFAVQERCARLHARGLPPWVRKAKRAAHRLVQRLILPDVRLPVRVQSGLSQGLWIQPRLPEEAGYWRGQKERGTEGAILATVREGSVVYDVGAHIGAVTFGVARLVGKSGRVVAFDADPENIASLRESCVLNHFEERIQVLHRVVWSYSSSSGIRFRRGALRRSHGGVEADGCRPVLADGATITVPATTLDEFVASSGIVPELVKVDVEGGEYEVLRGGEILFRRERPRVLVEVHHQQAFEQISRWMTNVRYSAQWEVPPQGFPRMLFAWPAESPPDV
jgi:FkbM family methyltransferase